MKSVALAALLILIIGAAAAQPIGGTPGPGDGGGNQTGGGPPGFVSDLVDSVTPAFLDDLFSNLPVPDFVKDLFS